MRRYAMKSAIVCVFILALALSLCAQDTRDFFLDEYDYAVADNSRNPGMIGPIALGDINGDGYDDLILAAPRAVAAGQADTGMVYVRFGLNFGCSPAQIHEFSFDLTTSSSQYADPTVSALNLPDGYGRLGGVQINGENPGGLFGQSVATGDFDGDGICDVAISAGHYLSPLGPGKVYVIRGRTDIEGTISLEEERAYYRSFVINGRENGDRFGEVLFLADVDNDGRDDLIIGTPRADQGGIVDIFYGRDFIPFFSQGVEALPTPHTKIISGLSGEEFGAAFAAGDLNGDGMTDLAVAAPGYSGKANNAGRAFLFAGAASDFDHGKPFPSGTILLASTTDTLTVVSNSRYERFGSSLAIGDINNDGRRDLAVGAPGWGDEAGMLNAGRICLFFNDGTVFSQLGGARTLSTSQSSVRLRSPNAGDRAGERLEFLNFDRISGPDLLATGPRSSTWERNWSGQAWVIQGTGIARAWSLGDYLVQLFRPGVEIYGQLPGDYMGNAAAAGDFNGDGFEDVFFTGKAGTNDEGLSAWGLYGGENFQRLSVSRKIWSVLE